MREVTIKLWGRHGEIWPELPPFDVDTTGFSWELWQNTAKLYCGHTERLVRVKILNGHVKMTFKDVTNV